MAAVQLVMFDLAGTTVDDTVSGLPLVAVVMKDAFKTHGIDIEAETVNEFRGLEKREAIRQLFVKTQGRDPSSEVVDRIFQTFKETLTTYLSSIKKEIPGTTATFKYLKSKGIKIAVGSGFPHSVVESIVKTLGWSGLLDYVSSSEKEGHGRPHPAMIDAAIRACQVRDPKSVVKVGDSKADVEEGKNAGCWTVAVLTGTQDTQTLQAANPDFVIASVMDLPSVLKNIEGK
ncbi:phosphonoacetaldehyde hydrolase [Nematostella vectensis]|uniref:phosphonoacetaldehyde hydrolase n=1 Tax=Nematostella vectensis TaxID=45351 RepID=UPI002076FA29|nr:phosphonoacetaldehyde hydrolase [Nematostella vectensis]